MTLSERDRAGNEPVAATTSPQSVLVVGDSFPHGRTVARWRQRSIDLATAEGRSVYTASAAIASGEVTL